MLTQDAKKSVQRQKGNYFKNDETRGVTRLRRKIRMIERIYAFETSESEVNRHIVEILNSLRGVKVSEKN